MTTTDDKLVEERERNRKILFDRHPLPEQARPLVQIWDALAQQLAALHGDGPTRSGLNGLGELYPPRVIEDGGPRVYRLFLVYFLPVPGKPNPINHHLHVDIGTRVDERGNFFVKIQGGSHAGRNASFQHDAYAHDEREFADDLWRVAETTGLLRTDGAES